MPNLEEEIQSIITPEIASESVMNQYSERLKEGNPTRDENPASHYCAYFLPYNKKTQQVFLGHHKKSGLWLSPGGHIDKGEMLFHALTREIREELGVIHKPPENLKPFLLTITPINNPSKGPCRFHYDV